MTHFLCGLITGLIVGSVAGGLAFNRWTLPATIERAYREGWLKPGPEATAETERRVPGGR
jgi:hypothetical protein